VFRETGDGRLPQSYSRTTDTVECNRSSRTVWAFMLYSRQKRLNFLPECRQCVLINDFILILYGLFCYKTLINTVENETLLQNKT